MGYDSSTNQLADPPTNPNATTDTTNNYLIDDYTGFKVAISEGLVTEWNGTMTTAAHWSPKHPQLFVRSRQEVHKGSPRPEQPDRFIIGSISDTFVYLTTEGGDILTIEDGAQLIL